MQLALYLLPLLPLTNALGLYSLPPIPSRLSVPASVATYAASVASAEATALSIENSQGISNGKPNPALPDPCGPPTGQISASANSDSTCQAKICTNHTSSPEKYGATCIENGDSATISIIQTLDVNACANAMIELCYTMAGSYGTPPTDEWVFTNGTTIESAKAVGAQGGGNCTVGFWLPSGGAPAPSFLRCVDSIFNPLVSTCAAGGEGSVSGGSVNLSLLPTFGVSSAGDNKGGVNQVGYGGTGVAVDGGYPSYFFVA